MDEPERIEGAGRSGPDAARGSAMPHPVPADAGPVGPTLPRAALVRLVRRALAEDAPGGDLSAALLPPETAVTAVLRAREAGVFAGGRALVETFRQVDPDTRVTGLAPDGTVFEPAHTLAVVRGRAAAVLTAERVALNLVQRLSGTATLTRRFVDAVACTRARIVDTRKTTPGLRVLQREAVRAGGGRNHRTGLSDAVMLKDNHLAALGVAGPEDAAGLTRAVRAARERLGHTVHLEVEVDRLDQVEPVVAGGADSILLDNMTPAELRRAVAIVAGRAITEASGGVDLDRVAAIAGSGVDLISVGRLTHGAPALDLGLDVIATGPA